VNDVSVRAFRQACCIGLVLLLTGAATHAEEPVPSFEEAWRLVRSDFYDPSLRGLDWEKIGQIYRPQALAAQSAEERSAVINRMLGELGASHTGHYTPEQVAYYDLFDIFGGALRRERERIFPGGRVAYDGIGAIVRNVDGRNFVVGILEGFPAARAGLRTGDEILGADGAPFHEIASFKGKAGKPVTLKVRRSAGAEPQHMAVVPEQIRPADAYFDAMRASVKVIEREGAKIGYVRIWSYAGHRYQELLEEELSTGRLAGADALVWDLRDGWGGAQLSYLEPFDRSGPTMTLVNRNGERELIGFRWNRPVAMLANDGTRSGKEILAYGLKTRGFGEVVGERTAGAVLAGRAFILPDDTLLLLAVADVLVDGERLEGNGVTPSIEVPFDVPYSEGRDPQLEEAVKLLAHGVKS
jgi:carboxyl-terminal processing protease